MIRRLGRRVLKPCLGHRRFQNLFQATVDVGLAGLNIGEGTDPRSSGERFAAKYVQAWLGPRSDAAILFDVGANIGNYARSLLEIFGSSARVWAFEPAEGAFSVLQLKLGGIANLNLRRLALGDRNGTAVLHAPAKGSKLATLHDMHSRLQQRGLHISVEEQVELSTIDDFCRSEDLERIDFLKLDVEGHELSVLRGASEMIERDAIGAIQFEFGAANLDSRTYFRDFYLLLSPKYSLYRVLQDGLFPIDRYKETHEIFKRATNYLALSRK
jgi:FkbM family methyltransferase